MAKTGKKVPLACGLAAGGLGAAPLLFLQPGGFGAAPRGAAGPSAEAEASASAPLSGAAPQLGGAATTMAFGAAALAAAAAAGSGRARRPRVGRRAAKAPSKAKKPAEPVWSLDKQIGATMPLGGFDPLGFSNTEGKFWRMREAEIKHGRVAMMASVGIVGQKFLAFKGFPENAGMGALVVACGIVEVYVWNQDPKKEPGNFGDPLGLNMYTEDMRNKEINNGRMAMLSCFGIYAAWIATGIEDVDQLQVLSSKMNLPALPF